MDSNKLQPRAPDTSAAVVAEDKPSRPRRPLGQGGWRNRAVCLAAYAVMLLAVLLGFDFVRTFGVNVFWLRRLGPSADARPIISPER